MTIVLSEEGESTKYGLSFHVNSNTSGKLAETLGENMGSLENSIVLCRLYKKVAYIFPPWLIPDRKLSNH